jgi:hypothetical protein
MGRNNYINPRASEKLYEFQEQVENELGLMDRIEDIGYRGMTSFECGTIGGEMTRRVWENYEDLLSENKAEPLPTHHKLIRKFYADIAPSTAVAFAKEISGDINDKLNMR